MTAVTVAAGPVNEQGGSVVIILKLRVLLHVWDSIFL